MTDRRNTGTKNHTSSGSIKKIQLGIVNIHIRTYIFLRSLNLSYNIFPTKSKEEKALHTSRFKSILI